MHNDAPKCAAQVAGAHENPSSGQFMGLVRGSKLHLAWIWGKWRPERMLTSHALLPTITPDIPHTTSQHVSILNSTSKRLFSSKYQLRHDECNR